jgi:hypothetical protein
MYLYYIPAKEVAVDVAIFADDAALFTSNIKCKQNHVNITAYSNQNRWLVFEWNIKMTRARPKQLY